MSDKTPGGTFTAPPPDAPMQVAEPLAPSTLAEQLAKARANERELTPFVPPAASTPAVPTAGADAPQPSASGAPADGSAPAVPPRQVQTPREVVAAPVFKRPAESDTDSPTRGIPKPIQDPGKVITGGFGSLESAQYFALDGSELRELVLSLMDSIADRIRNDLRFAPAITYPRVTARVQVQIEGYAEDHGFVVEKVKADERTPLEVAKTKADEVVFVVVEQRREFDAEGNPENPPDRVRDELGLPKPRKQFVQAGAAKMIVDTPSSLDGSF